MLAGSPCPVCMLVRSLFASLAQGTQQAVVHGCILSTHVSTLVERRTGVKTMSTQQLVDKTMSKT